MSDSLILASASPRRRELLQRIGISAEVLAADVDESVLAGEEAVGYATRVASAKAEKVADARPGEWVLAADTVVEVAGAPMGKAADRKEAEAMLRGLRGTAHRVTTAISLCRTGEGAAHVSRAITTEVVMRDFTDAELLGYLDAPEWQGKAGAYAVQGMAAAFVTEIRGSISNVIGLPLAEVVALLAERGVAVPNYPAGIPS